MLPQRLYESVYDLTHSPQWHSSSSLPCVMIALMFLTWRRSTWRYCEADWTFGIHAPIYIKYEKPLLCYHYITIKLWISTECHSGSDSSNKALPENEPAFLTRALPCWGPDCLLRLDDAANWSSGTIPVITPYDSATVSNGNNNQRNICTVTNTYTSSVCHL